MFMVETCVVCSWLSGCYHYFFGTGVLGSQVAGATSYYFYYLYQFFHQISQTVNTEKLEG